MVDHGIGAVSYGKPFQSGPITTDTTFTLTVSGSDGPTVQKSLTIQPVVTTGRFQSLDTLALAGGYLQATSLQDGRVLVTGGSTDTGGGANPEAQLIDRAAQTIQTTGSMLSPRCWHTATLLANGQVLVAGGSSTEWSTTGYRSAELFDPSTGTFRATGDLTTARWGPNLRAVGLTTGEVLLVGGNAESTAPSAEIYDPVVGTFHAVGAPSFRHEGFSLTLLGNGQVLLVGAEDAWASLPTPAELFDPVVRAFTSSVRPLSFHSWHTATMLQDGSVLVAGGGQYLNNTEAVPSTAAEYFDPIARTFRPTGSMIATRKYHGATLLSDGRVLIAGGSSFVGPMELAEVYTPATGAFALTGSLAVPRRNPVLVALPQGQALVLGGTAFTPLGIYLGPSFLIEGYQ
ncbi:MAG TPA: kelch repeat-containing protein [Geothrix sp.]